MNPSRTTLSRRHFTQTLGSVAAGLGLLPASALAVEPFRRAGHPRLLLSMAAYSFRDYFKDTSHRRDKPTADNRQIDLFQFVDYCAEHGCAGTELTSYYFPAGFDRSFLVRLRRHCFLRGVAVSGTAVANTFTHPPGEARDKEIRHVKQWVDHAAILGAPHIRVFAGEPPRGLDPAHARRNCIESLDECGDYAGQFGIFLGIENHGGIVAEAPDLLEIVRAVKSPWIGINLDSGNFHTDDPYRDFAACAPFAVNVQMKSEVQFRGRKQEAADLKRLVQALRDASYQGYVALEYEAAEDPWTAVPGILKTMRDLFNS